MKTTVWIVQWFDWEESGIAAVCIAHERAVVRMEEGQAAATDKGLYWEITEHAVDVSP